MEKGRKDKGGVPSGSIYCKSLSFPGAAQSRTCSSPALPAGLLGEGPAVLILRCVHLGELLRPHRVPGSVGAVYPVRPLFLGGPPLSGTGDTRRNNTAGGGQLSSPGVSSPSNYRSLLVHRGVDAPRAGHADLHSSGAPRCRIVLYVLSFPPPLLSLIHI